jgi:hypothetical protein
MNRRIDGHVVKEYNEGTSRHHYDVHEPSALGDWFGDKIAGGLKSMPEVRAYIREHNEEVRNSKK